MILYSALSCSSFAQVTFGNGETDSESPITPIFFPERKLLPDIVLISYTSYAKVKKPPLFEDGTLSSENDGSAEKSSPIELANLPPLYPVFPLKGEPPQ